jgi:hypothetical protein
VGTGFLASLAVALDLGAAVWALGLGVFLVVRRPHGGYVLFLLGAALPALAHLVLTIELTGDALPFYGRSELYQYPGSYWENPADFDRLREPRWLYAIHALIGHHGLFALTPWFLFAIPGALAIWRVQRERALAAVLAAVCLGTMAIYLLWGPSNYGGTCTGMRWFIVLTPLLWYAALSGAALWQHSRRWPGMVFRVLVVVGIIHASLALSGPWQVSPWNLLFRALGIDSVSS